MGIFGFWKKKRSSSSVGQSNPDAGRKCDLCGGPLRVIFQGRPWVYYHCSSCSIDVCNPCAARAGRAHPTASAACPKCKGDLSGSRM